MMPDDNRDLVISSEQFFNFLSTANLPRLVGLVDACKAQSETVVVLYLRRWDDFVNSMFLQSVRHGRVPSNPADYAEKRLQGVSKIFAAVKMLKANDGFECKVFAYNQKVDIRRHFETLMPSLQGLSAVGNLPRTEKLTLKQQVAISFATEIMQSPVNDDAKNRIVARIRRGALRFEGDLSDYSVIPPELDSALRESALKAARENGLDDYVEAFETVAPVKNYQRYDPSVLTEADIALFRDLVASIRAVREQAIAPRP